MQKEYSVVFECLEIEMVGSVLRIALARESARNAQSMLMLDELNVALDQARQNSAVRVVVLTSRGKHFSAGHDLKEAQRSRAQFTVEERWAYEEERYYDLSLKLWDFPKPTICEVRGGCVAAGFMVANMCDLIVASEDAFFSDPVVQTLSTAAVEVLIHPWAMGLRKAKEFLFTGESMSAAEAYRIGMVNRLVSNDELVAKTMELAERIAKAQPFALKIIKKSLNRTYDAQGFRTALSAHFDTHQLSHTTEEFKRIRDAGLASAILRSKS